MKYIATILLTILINITNAQEDTLLNEYTQVITIDNNNASTLIIKAKKHLAKLFVSANDVIQLDATNSLLSKGTTKVTVKALGVSTDYYINFSYAIDCKDNKYRYKISEYILQIKTTVGNKTKDCPLTQPKDNWLTNKQWASVKNQAAATFTNIINELKKEMAATDTW